MKLRNAGKRKDSVAEAPTKHKRAKNALAVAAPASETRDEDVKASDNTTGASAVEPLEDAGHRWFLMKSEPHVFSIRDLEARECREQHGLKFDAQVHICSFCFPHDCLSFMPNLQPLPHKFMSNH